MKRALKTLFGSFADVAIWLIGTATSILVLLSAGIGKNAHSQYHTTAPIFSYSNLGTLSLAAMLVMSIFALWDIKSMMTEKRLPLSLALYVVEMFLVLLALRCATP